MIVQKICFNCLLESSDGLELSDVERQNICRKYIEIFYSINVHFSIKKLKLNRTICEFKRASHSGKDTRPSSFQHERHNKKEGSNLSRSSPETFARSSTTSTASSLLGTCL